MTSLDFHPKYTNSVLCINLAQGVSITHQTPRQGHKLCGSWCSWSLLRLPVLIIVPSEQVYKALVLALPGGLCPIPMVKGLKEASGVHIPDRAVHC